jgi:hypothetical protein
LQGAAEALEAAKRQSDAEYDPGSARLFMAQVHAKLLERLSTGDIIQARALDPPAKDDPEADTPRSR